MVPWKLQTFLFALFSFHVSTHWDMLFLLNETSYGCVALCVVKNTFLLIRLEKYRWQIGWLVDIIPAFPRIHQLLSLAVGLSDHAVLLHCFHLHWHGMQFWLAIDPFVADMLCLVLVDDRNLRVADFAQFWATAKVYSVSFEISFVSFSVLCFLVLLGVWDLCLSKWVFFTWQREYFLV